jgi:ornithine--oxo-acid transaminase
LAAPPWVAQWRALRCASWSRSIWWNRSAEMGKYFLGLLKSMRSAAIKEVRGAGLWIGIELHGAARPYCEALKEEGVLCKETRDRVLRIAPPLIITKDEIDWGFAPIRKVLEKH